MNTPQAAAPPDAPAASRSTTGSRLFIAAMFLSAGAHLFTCMGGEMQREGLPLSLSGALLVWFAFARYSRPRRFDRIVAVVFVLFCSLTLAKNILDVN